MKIDDVIKKEEGSNDYEERLLMNLYHINNEQIFQYIVILLLVCLIVSMNQNDSQKTRERESKIIICPTVHL